MHITGKEVAKTVVVRTGKETALAVLPASCHVNLTRLGKLTGSEPRLASEAEFIDKFPDCELGAMPPFGNLYKLPVYVDERLAADEEIVFNAGTHRDAIRMRFEDFDRLAHPLVGGFADKG
jgi:Ala-tRNA(Pro) deacylase